MSLKLGFYQNCKFSFSHLYERASVSSSLSLFLAYFFFHVSVWWPGFGRNRALKVRSSPYWDTCKVLMGNLHCLLNSKKKGHFWALREAKLQESEKFSDENLHLPKSWVSSRAQCHNNRDFQGVSFNSEYLNYVQTIHFYWFSKKNHILQRAEDPLHRCFLGTNSSFLPLK